MFHIMCRHMTDLHKYLQVRLESQYKLTNSPKYMLEDNIDDFKKSPTTNIFYRFSWVTLKCPLRMIWVCENVAISYNEGQSST